MLNPLKIALIAFVFMGFSGCSNAESPEEASLTQAWNQGKVIVGIVNGPEELESETYADWSAYLNDFASDAGEDYFFQELPESIPGFSFESQPRPYSLLFFRKGEVGYLYGGAVVEPQVYEFVQRYYAGDTIPAHLEEFQPEPVEVDLNSNSGKFEVRRN